MNAGRAPASAAGKAPVVRGIGPCYPVRVAKKALSTAPLSADQRIVVLVGKEPFLMGEYTAQLRELLRAKFGEVDQVRFEAGTAGTTLASVLDECRTFGLMAAHKLVVVEGGDELIKEDNRPLIERYAAAPCEGATLLLRCGKWHAGKLDALIEKVGMVKAVEEVSAPQALAWADKRCVKRYEATLDSAAARLLVERLGPDLGRIDSELAKLSAYVGPGKPITREAVIDLVGRSSDEEAWVMQSVLLRGDAALSLAKLRELSELAREPVQKTMWATVDLARKLHGAARGLRAGENPWSLAGKLKLWGDSKDAILATAKGIDPAMAAGLLTAAVEADYRSKTGGADPERALEGLALEFARVLGGGRPAPRV